jgi:hypothetical protein
MRHTRRETDWGCRLQVGEAFGSQYRNRILVGLDPVHESDGIKGVCIVRVHRDCPFFECLGPIELFDVAIEGGFLLESLVNEGEARTSLIRFSGEDKRAIR